VRTLAKIIYRDGKLLAPVDDPATIDFMQLAIFGMRVLELMFFVGLVGSAIVVLISFVEDAKELFGED
jgi:hypothetical protein